MNRTLQVLVKTFIVLGMIVGAAGAVWAIYTMTRFPSFSMTDDELLRAYVSGALGLVCIGGCEFIAATLFQMMCSLSRDPFVKENVRALRRMGFAALAVTACALLTMAFWAVPLAVIGALPVGMCGLFSLVLSDVFARAVAFKEENELTV